MKRQKTHFALSAILLFIAIAVFVFNGCKKEEPAPENPYSSIDYTPKTTNEIPPDPYSITGLHKNVFSLRCAKPGCHDGNFEPDFRTVQSSYSTLVYHRIKKNNAANTFTYRVVPYDKVMSVLYERLVNCCFVNTDDRMPQDNIGIPLPQSDIDAIGKWISDGAKDINGNVNTLPNLKPTVDGYVAIDGVSGARLDTIRVGGNALNPFIAPANKLINIYFLISDDSTAIKDLIVNKLKLSTKENDFTGAISYTGTYIEIPPYKLWRVDVNTAALATGTTYYMRYYVNDGDHTVDTEFPTDLSVYYYKSVYAFVVQ